MSPRTLHFLKHLLDHQVKRETRRVLVGLSRRNLSTNGVRNGPATPGVNDMFNRTGLCRESDIVYDHTDCKKFTYISASLRGVDIEAQQVMTRVKDVVFDESHFNREVSPIFGAVLAQNGVDDVIGNALNLSPEQISLERHFLTYFSPLPLNGERLKNVVIVSDFEDRQDCAYIVIDVATRRASDDWPVIFNQFYYKVPGFGGFGGPRYSDRFVVSRRSIGHMVGESLPSYTFCHTLEQESVDLYSSVYPCQSHDTYFDRVSSTYFEDNGVHTVCQPVNKIHLLATVVKNLQDQENIDTHMQPRITVSYTGKTYPGRRVNTSVFRLSPNLIYTSTIDDITGELLLTCQVTFVKGHYQDFLRRREARRNKLSHNKPTFS